ncbi:MAG: hypothetical protein EPO21_23090 [Chloroflexota bacterium]|nr:MAG: hypothetical protein EPO21_23090 [Chloroflexota bacterium]
MNPDDVDQALVLLRRSIAAADEALSAMASLDQLDDRFDVVALRLIDEPEIWSAANNSLDQAKQALFHARGCLDEILSQVTRGQAQETQARAWADQLVDLNERLQSTLAHASQQASQFYETLRPTLISHYLEHSTKVPRWADTWPRDVEAASKALLTIAHNPEKLGVDQLDIQLARFRWEVGWSQQRIASIAGLSQPSVAARLSKMDSLISSQVGTDLALAQIEREGAQIVRWHVLGGRGARGSDSEIVVELEGCTVHLELLVATGESGAGRRAAASARGTSLDYLRLEFADQRQRSAGRSAYGIAIYYRDRGVVGYYTAAEVVDALRRFGNQSAEAILQRLRDILEPSRTIREFLQRAERSTQDQEP